MESFGNYFTVERRDAYQPIKHVYVKKKELSQFVQVDNDIQEIDQDLDLIRNSDINIVLDENESKSED